VLNATARAIQAAQRAASRVQGGSIVYQRGESRVTIDRATLGKTEFQVEADGAVRIEHTDRDFIFEAESLILGGQIAKPARGDRVTMIEPDGKFGDVYEVLAPAGQQVYRESDQFGVMIRVFGKKL
jgi:hypothetical protein